MRKLHAIDVTLFVAQVQTEVLTFDEQLFTVREFTNAQFRPLKVSQNADRAVTIFFDLTDDFVTLTNFGVLTMAHVQAKDVCPRFVQSTDHLVAAGSRAQRSNDFYVALASHGAVLILNIWSVRYR